LKVSDLGTNLKLRLLVNCKPELKGACRGPGAMLVLVVVGMHNRGCTVARWLRKSPRLLTRNPTAGSILAS
jgi:hypothetical protein